VAPARSPVPTIERTAWIEQFEILDAVAGDDTQSTDGPTLLRQLAEAVKQGQYFRDVRLPPGNPGPDDVHLRFRFDGYHAHRRVHPAYLPAALLTATFYIWFGGPIYRDDVAYMGTVDIYGSDGVLLAQGTGGKRQSENVSLYSDDYPTADWASERDRAIAEMLASAVSALRAKSVPQTHGGEGAAEEVHAAAAQPRPWPLIERCTKERKFKTAPAAGVGAGGPCRTASESGALR
jgi:hypothetical protein